MTTYEYHNAGNTEAQEKEALAYLLAQSSTGKAATGVIVGLGVTQTTTASGSVQVGAGAGVVQSAVLDGASVLVNDSALTLDVLTANPYGGVARNDIVVFDATTATVKTITGSPNVTPSDPTIPATSLPLARLRITSSTIPSSAIDDLRTFTTLAGGRPVVASASVRDALTKYNGLRVWRSDVKREETWDGTGWLTEVYGMDQLVSTNNNGEFNFDTGLSSIKYANIYNGNGGIVRAGGRNNITIARNTSGATYTAGTLVGIIYAAETKVAVANTTARVDWIAKGYA